MKVKDANDTLNNALTTAHQHISKSEVCLSLCMCAGMSLYVCTVSLQFLVEARLL